MLAHHSYVTTTTRFTEPRPNSIPQVPAGSHLESDAGFLKPGALLQVMCTQALPAMCKRAHVVQNASCVPSRTFLSSHQDPTGLDGIGLGTIVSVASGQIAGAGEAGLLISCCRVDGALQP